MKIINFTQFIQSIQTNENSDLDWSDKNWDERGQDGENPPNNGFEGTSAFQADYHAGDYGETGEEEIYLESEEEVKPDFSEVKATIDDLTQRIVKLESKNIK